MFDAILLDCFQALSLKKKIGVIDRAGTLASTTPPTSFSGVMGKYIKLYCIPFLGDFTIVCVRVGVGAVRVCVEPGSCQP